MQKMKTRCCLLLIIFHNVLWWIEFSNRSLVCVILFTGGVGRVGGWSTGLPYPTHPSIPPREGRMSCQKHLDHINSSLRDHLYLFSSGDACSGLQRRPLADLGGMREKRAPRPKISSFSCSFREKLAK